MSFDFFSVILEDAEIHLFPAAAHEHQYGACGGQCAWNGGRRDDVEEVKEAHEIAKRIGILYARAGECYGRGVAFAIVDGHYSTQSRTLGA